MRTKTLIWMLSVLAAVAALLYWEQAAMLFVISTLAVSILLLVVAFADLEGRDRELNKQVNADQTPIAESAVTTGSSSHALADPRAMKREKGAA